MVFKNKEVLKKDKVAKFYYDIDRYEIAYISTIEADDLLVAIEDKDYFRMTDSDGDIINYNTKKFFRILIEDL
jgi:hypothetical protein